MSESGFEKKFYKIFGLYLTQAEGLILGLGAKLFTIAGPVIVYGVATSVIYGIIYYLMR